MDHQLVRESKVFSEHIGEWRKTHMGQVVLIKDDQIVGFYPSIEHGFRVGTAKFGLEPFLVRQIVPDDVVNVSFYGRRVKVA